MFIRQFPLRSPASPKFLKMSSYSFLKGHPSLHTFSLNTFPVSLKNIQAPSPCMRTWKTMKTWENWQISRKTRWIIQKNLEKARKLEETQGKLAGKLEGKTCGKNQESLNSAENLGKTGKRKTMGQIFWSWFALACHYSDLSYSTVAKWQYCPARLVASFYGQWSLVKSHLATVTRH